MTEEDQTETSSATDVENEADVSKPAAEGATTNGHGKPYNQPTDSGKLVDEEARAEGRVSMRTYWMYIRAAGIISWIFTFVLMLLIRFINVGLQVSVAGCEYRWITEHAVVLPRKVG